jgi:hypothetical protein
VPNYVLVFSTPKLADSLGGATHRMFGVGQSGLRISKALMFLFLDDFFGDHVGEFFPVFDAGAFFFRMNRQTSPQRG